MANAHNEWVALLLAASGGGFDEAALQAMFGASDLLAAAAPLDCILLLDAPAPLTPAIMKLLPASRVALAFDVRALEREGTARRLAELQGDGYRVLLDGVPADGTPAALRSVSRLVGADCEAVPPAPLPALFGPHLARGVDTPACQRACAKAGFTWFSGAYGLAGGADAGPIQGDDDGTSRRRLLTMLALLARDADSRELEAQLKQDPALSYHLLKLVNSAAFSAGAQITSFGQAISRIGRRQLQRWLQLLLYARQQPDGPPNLLLPSAAYRGALLEELCRRDGGDRDQQDLAFMTGVFSLLDRLIRMPMPELVRDLKLPQEVEAALLARDGRLGRRLRLCQQAEAGGTLLEDAGTDSLSWWQAQIHAYHWAIQVARNV